MFFWRSARCPCIPLITLLDRQTSHPRAYSDFRAHVAACLFLPLLLSCCSSLCWQQVLTEASKNPIWTSLPICFNPICCQGLSYSCCVYQAVHNRPRCQPAVVNSRCCPAHAGSSIACTLGRRAADRGASSPDHRSRTTIHLQHTALVVETRLQERS